MNIVRIGPLVPTLLLMMSCAPKPPPPTPEAPGLWRVTERIGKPVTPGFELEACAPIEYWNPFHPGFSRAVEWSRCAVTDKRDPSGAFERTKVCPAKSEKQGESMSIAVLLRLEGDFRRAVREVTSARVTSTSGEDGEIVRITTGGTTRVWTRIGDCPAGMKPGESRVPVKR